MEKGGGRAREREDPLALAGCSSVGIRCISWLHLVDENIMPIVRAARGLLCKHVEFIRTRTVVNEITPRDAVSYIREVFVRLERLRYVVRAAERIR